MFGNLKKVTLREVWPHEASNFTPWLAENITELGKTLGLELELLEQEASVGDFSLDILAKDLGSSKTVIIENQLTQTDHDHLGKLLTYAAGFDSSIIIWVCETFREEHRQALDWLNQRTDSDTSFFGVAIEVIQIDDSKPAFNFKLVAYPNEWLKSKKRQSKKTALSSKSEKYQTYFQDLIDELREKHKFTAAKKGQPQSWYAFSSSISGIAFTATFAQGGKIRSELYIDLKSQEQNKFIFDRLYENKALIEQEIGEEFQWERLDDKQASRLAFISDGNIEASAENLDTYRNWHISHLLKLKSVMPKYISKLAAEAKQL